MDPGLRRDDVPRCDPSFLAQGSKKGVGWLRLEYHAATWKREPLNLVAVVDKSGSMDGEPLDLVRQSLKQIVGQMGDRDQLSITDEQPNVGATDSESFMGMAEAASRRGIGLTTIGVGIQFGAELGMRMSSVRGGNLFFLSDEEEVKSVFEKQLDTMVTEVARDVRITLTPRKGYRLTGVFGVPDGLRTDVGEGAVTIMTRASSRPAPVRRASPAGTRRPMRSTEPGSSSPARTRGPLDLHLAGDPDPLDARQDDGTRLLLRRVTGEGDTTPATVP